MNIDLKEMSLSDLSKLKTKIEKIIVRKEAKMKTHAIAELKKKAVSLGFSLTDLVGDAGMAADKRSPKSKSIKRATVKQKYKNPEDPNQTWSGRGRKPKWLEKGILAGGELEDFLIK